MNSILFKKLKIKHEKNLYHQEKSLNHSFQLYKFYEDVKPLRDSLLMSFLFLFYTFLFLFLKLFVSEKSSIYFVDSFIIMTFLTFLFFTMISFFNVFILRKYNINIVFKKLYKNFVNIVPIKFDLLNNIEERQYTIDLLFKDNEKELTFEQNDYFTKSISDFHSRIHSFADNHLNKKEFCFLLSSY